MVNVLEVVGHNCIIYGDFRVNILDIALHTLMSWVYVVGSFSVFLLINKAQWANFPSPILKYYVEKDNPLNCCRNSSNFGLGNSLDIARDYY